VEETRTQWESFLAECNKFEEWLSALEKASSMPRSLSTETVFESMQDEMKKFEAFQKALHDGVDRLERLNKAYRSLVRSNRADSANQLKDRISNLNQRYDALCDRLRAVSGRLQHTLALRDEYRDARRRCMAFLALTEARLAEAEVLSDSPEEQRQAVEDIERAVSEQLSTLQDTEVQCTAMFQRAEPGEACDVIEPEVTQYLGYKQEVLSRLEKLVASRTHRQPGNIDPRVFNLGTTLSLSKQLLCLSTGPGMVTTTK